MQQVGNLTKIRLYRDPNASLSPDVSSEAPVTSGGSTDLAPDHNARVRVPASFPRSDVSSWSLPASSSDEAPSSNSKLFLVSEKTGGASSSLGSDISKSLLVDWSSPLLDCWNNLDLRCIILHRLLSAEPYSSVACDMLLLLAGRGQCQGRTHLPLYPQGILPAQCMMRDSWLICWYDILTQRRVLVLLNCRMRKIGKGCSQRFF